MNKLSNDYKLKCIELAEAALAELDKLENQEKRNLVAWVSNFWGNASQVLASYSLATPELRDNSKKGAMRSFEVGREMINKK